MGLVPTQMIRECGPGQALLRAALSEIMSQGASPAPSLSSACMRASRLSLLPLKLLTSPVRSAPA